MWDLKLHLGAKQLLRDHVPIMLTLTTAKRVQVILFVATLVLVGIHRRSHVSAVNAYQIIFFQKIAVRRFDLKLQSLKVC